VKSVLFWISVWAMLIAPHGLAAGGGSVPAFPAERAFELLERQVEFGPRAPGTEAHRATLSWMLGLLREKADKVLPHTFVQPDPRGEGSLQLTNVKASFRPDLAPRYAFAAHWDCRPEADRQEGGPVARPIPGANDGASGVAVLLALAEVLHEHPPAIGIDLLFFDGEDYGQEGRHEDYLLGSRRFVKDFPSYRPAGVILLDMVGDADLRIPMEGNSLRYAPDLMNVVFNRALALGLPAFDPVPGDFILDDHVPFLQVGIPAVDLIDKDYPPWHTLDDLPEACSPESLGQVGTLALSLIFLDFAP
jgi:hypothetical protein